MEAPARIALELVRLVGTGGMGQVWEARYGGRRVAAKIITTQTDDGRWQLEREVHAMAQLHHPNIVDIYDFGAIEDPASVGAGDDVKPGSPFLIMDLASEGSLRDWIENERVTAWPFIRDTLLSLLAGLGHAHARYLIHRDVKPDNLLAFRDGDRLVWKLSDFGIAHSVRRDLDESGQTITGTPHYMAPEQFIGDWRNQTSPTDLYAVGCICFELCCGRPPFDDDSLIKLARQHLEQPMPAFEPIIDVPVGLGGWIARTLSKDPLHRHNKPALAASALCALDEELAPTQRLKAKRGPSKSRRAPLESAPTLAMEVPRSVAIPTIRARADGVALPVNADWRAVEEARAGHRGVSSPRLHALRPLRLVDRDEERDALWAAYVDAVESRQARLVVIEGERGTGKSRLAEWFCQFVMEVGGANWMHGGYSAEKGHGEGIGFMTAQFTRCIGLTSKELPVYLESLLRRWGLEDAWSVDVLTRFLAESASDFEADSQRSAQVFRPAALAKMLEQVCRRMPVIGWIDDVQWGDEALDLLDVVFTDAGPTIHAPAVFVVTAETRAMDSAPRKREALEALAARPGCTHLVIDKLRREDVAKLIAQAATIDEALIDGVLDMVDGSPAFATQLISDWIDRGVLSPDREGFKLRDGEQIDLDETLLDTWRRRLARALDNRNPADREAVELAAILGASVASTEWLELCAHAGCEPRRDLLGKLVEHGIAHWTDDGFSFAHSMARESILEASGTRLDAHHRRAAEFLTARRREHARPGLAFRIARHMAASDQLQSALSAWLQAARDQEAIGDFGGALAILEERHAAAQELEDVAAQSSGLSMMSLVYMRIGKLDEAASYARSAEAMARASGNDRSLGLAIAQHADVCIQDGRFHEALSMAEDAHALLETARDEEGVAVANLSIADCLAYMSRHDEAMERYQRAAHSTDLYHAAWADYGIGYVHLQRKNMDAAERHLSRALTGYEEVGATSYAVRVASALADHARVGGDLDTARKGYARVAAFLESVGDAKVAVTYLNLSLVAFASDEVDAAERCLARATAALEIMPQHHLDAAMKITELAVAAHRGDWPTWDATLAQARKALDESGVLELDDAWLADRAADMTEKAGERERARQLWELCVELWARIGLSDREEAARRRVAAL